MSEGIKTIELPMPLGMGTVNCYLLSSANGFILIDSGLSIARKELRGQLESAGCAPGSLQLIILTHGDFDHTGNARYLRERYGAKLAMHPMDAGMAKTGNMFVNRRDPGFLVKNLISLFTGFGKGSRFTPDFLLEEGTDLQPYGWEDARVISIPGHSWGSIGILTARGDFFCGDLFENHTQPMLNSIMDDREAGESSLARVKELKINTIYPGHGKPFTREEL